MTIDNTLYYRKHFLFGDKNKFYNDIFNSLNVNIKYYCIKNSYYNKTPVPIDNYLKKNFIKQLNQEVKFLVLSSENKKLLKLFLSLQPEQGQSKDELIEGLPENQKTVVLPDQGDMLKTAGDPSNMVKLPVRPISPFNPTKVEAKECKAPKAVEIQSPPQKPRLGDYQFIELLNCNDREFVHAIMDACKDDFESFSLYYNLFHKELNIALRLAKLVPNSREFYKKLARSTPFYTFMELLHPSMLAEIQEPYLKEVHQFLQQADMRMLNCFLDVIESYSTVFITTRLSKDFRQIKFLFSKFLESGEIFEHFYANSSSIKNYKIKDFIKFAYYLYAKKLCDNIFEMFELALVLSQKLEATKQYKELMSLGYSPQDFRDLSPYCLSVCYQKPIHRDSHEFNYLIEFTDFLKSRIVHESEMALFRNSFTLIEVQFIFDRVRYSAEEVYQRYIVRKSNWTKLYNDSNQIEYGSLMHRATSIASYMIGMNRTPRNILEFLASERGVIGRKNNPNGTTPGYPRHTPKMTSCDDVYAKVTQTILEFVQNGQYVNFLKCEKGSNIKDIPNIQFIESLNGNEVRLSQLRYFDTGSSTVMHTDPSNIEVIMRSVCDEMYPAALNETNPTLVMEKLGRIFWWICQANPWNLGDPSIAEMYIRTILLHKKLSNLPWKVDIVPWVEVMIEPSVESFAKKFHTLFDMSFEIP